MRVGKGFGSRVYGFGLEAQGFGLSISGWILNFSGRGLLNRTSFEFVVSGSCFS